MKVEPVQSFDHGSGSAALVENYIYIYMFIYLYIYSIDGCDSSRIIICRFGEMEDVNPGQCFAHTAGAIHLDMFFPDRSVRRIPPICEPRLSA